MRKSVLSAFLGLAALAASLSTVASDVPIRVDDAWVRRAPMLTSGGTAGTGTGAAYGKLVNSGGKPDALIAAESDVARAVELHQSYQDAGMMKMRPVDGIVVASGQTVEMKPGGYHIMFIDLKRDLRAGETVKLTLRFRDAGRIPVEAVIR